LRLSVTYRQPLHEVMKWPSRHIALLATFMSREPSPEIRIEQSLAQLSALVANAMRSKETKPAKLTDFLLYHNAFKKPEVELTSDRYSEADRLMLQSLSNLGKKPK
jgi:hypothetical protein